MYFKRGQITIFIFVGILLLVIVGVGISIYLDRQEKAAVNIPAIKLPAPYQPLQTFVEVCLRQIGEEGVRKVGMQGGYTTLDPQLFSINELVPTESDVVASPGGLLAPYWFYMQTPNECREQCVFSSKRPGLRGTGMSIEEQLETYITQELPACLEDFTGLAEAGLAVEQTGPLSTDVTITEEDVAVVVQLPVQARHGDSEQSVSEFGVRLPVRLKHIYDLAGSIADLEKSYQFIEEDTLNLLVGFSGRKKNIPPMTDSSLDYAPSTFWIKSEVAQHVEDMLMGYIPLLQVYQTKTYHEHQFPNDPLRESVFNEGMRVPMKKGFEDLAVTFAYLDWWPIYFDLNCKGELCVPQSVMSNIIFPIGVQRYHFAYDVSFPVQVEIYDEDAFNGKGYTFRYYLEANVRNNKPFTKDFFFLPTAPTRDVELVCTVMDERIVNVTDPISGEQTQKVEQQRECTEQQLATKTMLCDMDKRTSGTVRVATIAIQKPVSDAAITYSCASQTCAIGATDEEGMLVTRLPVCLGGLLGVNHPEYLGKTVPLDAFKGKASNVSIELSHLEFYNFTVKKRLMVKHNDEWIVQPTEQPINPFEQAIVILERNDSEFDQQLHALGSVDKDEMNPIRIAPGRYNIEVRIMSEEPFAIEEEERCVDAFIKEECYTIPRIELGGGKKKFISGGSKTTYTFTDADLHSGRIVFYAFAPALVDVTTVEDLQALDYVETAPIGTEALLVPTYER